MRVFTRRKLGRHPHQQRIIFAKMELFTARIRFYSNNGPAIGCIGPALNKKGNTMSSATVTIFTGFALGLGASALVLLV